MVALLLDLENLMHTSFVIEAYRTVEREHGMRPSVCVAFGSHIHTAHTEAVASRLGIEIVMAHKTWNVRVHTAKGSVSLGQVGEENEELARCAALSKFGREPKGVMYGVE